MGAAGLEESGRRSRCTKKFPNPVIEYDPEYGSTLFPQDYQRPRIGTSSFEHGSYFHKNLSQARPVRGTVMVAGSEVERRHVEPCLSNLQLSAASAPRPRTVDQRRSRPQLQGTQGKRLDRLEAFYFGTVKQTPS